jgi:hypothetical protein
MSQLVPSLSRLALVQVVHLADVLVPVPEAPLRIALEPVEEAQIRTLALLLMDRFLAFQVDADQVSQSDQVVGPTTVAVP